MNMIKKTTIAALAVTVLATGGLFGAGTSADAAPSVRIAPVQNGAVMATQVGYYHHHHYRRHYYGYHCFWIQRKFWDDYSGDYYFKPVRVCE
jgi:hypothetical protein